MVNGNGWGSILINAFAMGFLALMIGLIIGAIALRSINEQIEQHRKDNPVPDENDGSNSSNDRDGDIGQAAVG